MWPRLTLYTRKPQHSTVHGKHESNLPGIARVHNKPAHHNKIEMHKASVRRHNTVRREPTMHCFSPPVSDTLRRTELEIFEKRFMREDFLLAPGAEPPELRRLLVPLPPPPPPSVDAGEEGAEEPLEPPAPATEGHRTQWVTVSQGLNN